jgi:hypothetical protein
MKQLLIVCTLFVQVMLIGQEKYSTSDFNLHEKTHISEQVTYSIQEGTKKWESTKTYFFYNTYLDSIVVESKNSKEIIKYNYNIDNCLKSIVTKNSISELEDKIEFYYDKELKLVKSKEYLQGYFFSESIYSYDKEDRIFEIVTKEKNFKNIQIINYQYKGNLKFIKTTKSFEGKKMIEIQVENYKENLIEKGEYQIFDLKSKVVYKYDKRLNLIYEQKDAEEPTVYQYEYDVKGNPIKITVSNAGNPFVNAEINIKNTYSDFKN